MSAVPIGLILSATLVWQASNSAFSATTANPTNSWATGTVVLSDDDTGAAMFNATGLKPGSTAEKCIVVTYTSSLAATVMLYGTGLASTNSMSGWLSVAVEQAPVATTPTATASPPMGLAPPLLSGATSTASVLPSPTSATGSAPFAPVAGQASQTKSYRIVYELVPSTPNSVQGGTASIGLTWEARNS